MMKNIALSRPATSAIAAFLALSTPVAFAQEAPTVTMTPPVAAPTPQTPPTVPTPDMTAPVATPQTTQPTAPKPVIRLPVDIAPTETAEPKAAEPAAAPAPVRAERAAQRARPAAAASAPVANPSSAIPAETVPVEEIAPVEAAPVTAAAEPTAAPAPVAKTTAPEESFPWEIVGGAAALLLAGGTGLAFARRRSRENALHEEWEPAATAPTSATPVPVTASAAAPTTTDAQPWVTPAYVPRERTTPAFAAAPSGSMGRHEAMAMAGPTPDNPFATLSKRLKRARFLDRQERVTYGETLAGQKDMTRKPVSAWEIAQRPAPAVQEQEVRRPEPARGRRDLRPGFSRN